jgi:hypothetical protein
MSNQIPGVPAGWEVERIGQPIFNVDHVIDCDGKPKLCDFDSSYLNRVIIRKIEKPAKYRPFKDAAEYLPHWGKPLRLKGSAGFDSVVSTSMIGVYIATATKISYYSMADAFEDFVFDADGTPFGVKIDE